jgi:hypothetical protein
MNETPQALLEQGYTQMNADNSLKNIRVYPRLSKLIAVVLFGFTVSTAYADNKPTPTPTPLSEVDGLLAQAAAEFQQTNAPKIIHVLDQTEAAWGQDKSLKITVHQIWATRVAPDQPMSPIATINKDSQTFVIQNLQIYDLNDQGQFVKDPKPADLTWSPLGPNLPDTLSKIMTARLPNLSAGQAVEIKYTLETKNIDLLTNKDTHFDYLHPMPVPGEPSFALLWNDYLPSIQKDLTLKVPKNVALYAVKQRLPDNLAVTETTEGSENLTHLTINGPLAPIPIEAYQPAPQNLAPLTAFTLYKSWGDSLLYYRTRVKNLVDSDPAFINDFVGDAAGNTGSPMLDRLSRVKNLIHQKVDWVDTGLPIYLNPDRPLKEIVTSGKGTSHDMAILLTAALKAARIDAQIYLFRQSTSGDLIPDLPALSQMDGVLVGVPFGKDMIWMDPTEPLASPGSLPLPALDRDALAVFMPFNWKTTPSFSAKDHRKERDVTMTIGADGKLTCSVDILAFGTADLALRQFFRAADDDTRKSLVAKGLAKRFPGAVLTDYTFGNYEDLTQPLAVNYTFEVPHYAQFSKKGGLAFYPMVFEDIEDFFETLHNNRQTPVVIPQNFNSITRVVVKLPRGYHPTDLPTDAVITNDVAEFLSTSKIDFGTLSYERYVGLKKRVIDPGKNYTDLLSFYQSVLSQDRVPFKAVKK